MKYIQLVVMLLLSFKSIGAEYRPLLYKYTDDVYIFGTIHAAPSSIYPLPGYVQNAINSSHSLVLEISDLDEGGSVLSELKSKDIYELDVKSQDLVDKYCQNGEVSEICKQFGNSPLWLQSIIITLDRLNDTELLTTNGVDDHIRRNFKGNIYGLETVKSQLSVFSNLSSSIQNYMLQESITEDVSQDSYKLFNAWMHGDIDTISSFNDKLEEDGQKELADLLIYNRNENMAKKILELVNDSSIKKPIFVAVGVGHLVGDKSLISELGIKKVKKISP